MPYQNKKQAQVKRKEGHCGTFENHRHMDKSDSFEFPPFTQVGNEQKHLVSHSYKLSAKLKNVTGAGVFGGRIDPGKIKNFHGFPKKNFGKKKREYGL